ncbi:helix-turn-helix transcriptional regulator [Clostridium sp. 'deep sea']|uniref:PadR family transcriptional regulator n=1 Tax=Clostridium sp. 'deep sea' TaxID=2779445 RepID=UPI00189697C4|nr:helix-turn-helix transcriptional regulator [Clostridium sp. 'deep sea']QOR34904.1 helix-turn-helix transcriptional regulator [Clostridium sp. 'deep sea']
MKIDKGLVGGSTLLLLLSLISESDRYGYEIIKELEIRTESTFQFKEGTLYPVLHKLENKGYVKSYFQAGETGRKRKYYKITSSGKKQLAIEKAKWGLFSKSVNKVICGEAYALL